MLNADPQRNTAFERLKSSIAEAMQPGDARSTLHFVPPDEQETNLPIEQDEAPLYGRRQSTEFNGATGSKARSSAAGAVVGAGVGADVGPGATTSKKDQSMIASAGDMVGRALGLK
ncbi:uncharacterized protein BHQ10_002920 [Talaromyces amestolkiae]|uniref:Uncharacterized protein n=1 Tax=Talaromyces amestolkiae TaxID=1196081 RepID=A0A364KTN0_TALAM|nr:uncharacterized protein BHQ10_002920 [Talaromyces amestolkiae]RAO66908.1 hypothetical protein BHQ10_002920 [Talaromyces amestolkiae]